MPGISLEGLAQAGAAELEELRRELQAFGRAVEGQLEQAVRQVQPLARALRDLEEEHLVLRAELARLGRRLDLLALWLAPPEPVEKDLSTLFLEAQDPCAHFEGTEESGSPVAHPPTFSSTRQQSTLHLSRSDSFVSAGRAEPGWAAPSWAAPAVGGHGAGAEEKPSAGGGMGVQCGWISCNHSLLLWEAGAGQGCEPMAPACFALLACRPWGSCPGPCVGSPRGRHLALQWPWVLCCSSCPELYCGVLHCWHWAEPLGSQPVPIMRALTPGSGVRWGQVCSGAALARHLPPAASRPYSGPGDLPTAHCLGVVLKGTWCPGRAPAGAELA